MQQYVGEFHSRTASISMRCRSAAASSAGQLDCACSITRTPVQQSVWWHCKKQQHKSVYTKIVRSIRNVHDRAYAMSHLSAVESGYMSRPHHVHNDTVHQYQQAIPLQRAYRQHPSNYHRAAVTICSAIVESRSNSGFICSAQWNAPNCEGKEEGDKQRAVW